MAKAVAVVQLLATGETLRKACKEHHINVAAFRALVAQEPQLKAMYDEAVEIGNDMLADMLVNIDSECADARMAGVLSKNIQWLLERRQADKFGARVTVQTSNEASKLLAEALNKAIDRIPAVPSLPPPPTVTDVSYVDVTPDPLEELRRLGLI